MAKAAKDGSLNFIIKDTKGLIEFLKKFETIDPTALIDIVSDGNDTTVIIKSATPTHTSVKIGTIPFTEIFEPAKNIPQSVKIGVFNLEKFIKVLGAGDDTAKKLNIVYDADAKTGENYSKSFSVTYNEHLFGRDTSPVITFLCAPKTLFANIPDLDNKLFITKNAKFKLRMNVEDFEKFKKMISTDASDEVTFRIKNDQLVISGKTFIAPLGKDGDDDLELFDDEAELSIKKEYFKYLDKEVYNLFAVEKGLILESEDSEIKIAISSVLDPNSSGTTDTTNDDDESLFDDDEENAEDIFYEDED
jgi:hypothetical protein